MSDWGLHRSSNRVGSISINVHELVDEGEENHLVLEKYFEELVVPLAHFTRGRSSSGESHDDRTSILHVRQRSRR